MRRLSTILLAAAVGALAAPALASAAPSANGTRGIVVQRDAKAGVVVVATSSGSLVRVKFAKPNSLKMGSVVKVRGSKVAVVGHRNKAKLRGVVVRRHNKSFALADHGSVVGVSSPTPPSAGQQVTATVQVTPTELDDDDGDEHVNGAQVAGAEVRGTFLSASATTLLLTVPGFPTGLPISITGQTIPALTGLVAGTPVKAHVTFAPDPSSTQGGVLLTLVSLRVENNHHGDEHGHSGFVKAEGKVTAVTEAGAVGFEPGSITILGEHGMVTFVIPAGFGPTGVVVGDEVEAKGTLIDPKTGQPTQQPTLLRLEANNNNNNGNGDDHDDDDDSGGGHSRDGSGGDE